MAHLRESQIKDITEIGFFENNPKWIQAKKRSEEALANENRVYSELSRPARELVKEFTTKVGKGIAKLIKSDDIRGLGESLVEIFLKLSDGHERKVSVHIVAPIVGYGKVTEANLKVRNFVAGIDINLIIPEDATPQKVIRAVEILKPYLDSAVLFGKTNRENLIDKVAWKVRKHL